MAYRIKQKTTNCLLFFSSYRSTDGDATLLVSYGKISKVNSYLTLAFSKYDHFYINYSKLFKKFLITVQRDYQEGNNPEGKAKYNI